MPTLKFGPINKPVGFQSMNTASFSDMPPAKIIRELIQNALDAAAEAKQDAVIVRFQIDTVALDDIPDIEGYQAAFKNAIRFQLQASGGNLSDTAKQVISQIKDGMKSLYEGTALMLSVMDNAIGLNAKRMNSLLGDGAGNKPEDLSGSYGVGHLAPMVLSDIRYMLYGGVVKSGNRIVCGQAVLASHSGTHGMKAPDGFLVNRFGNGINGNFYKYLNKTQHPKIISDRLDSIREEWGHGSVIGIPAFNNFRQNKWNLWDTVSKIVAYNFCSAVYQGKLSIEVCEGDATRILDAKTLEDVLEEDKDRTRVARVHSFFEGLRPSGQNAYSIWRTLRGGKRESLKMRDGTAHISLLTPTDNGNTRVDLFRNGMWITDNIHGMKRADFANHQPFHAVIEVERLGGGELHRLVRKAEGPMHNEISFGRLSKTERAKLRTALHNIAQWMKDIAPEIENEEYQVDDYLMVETDAADIGGNRAFSYWGEPTPISRRRVSQVIDVIEPGSGPVDVPPPGPGPGPNPGPGPGPGPGPSPSKRHRRVNPLPFRSIVVPAGIGKLKGAIRSERDFDETLLTLQVDENMDSTCDKIWQDEDISIESFNIKPSSRDKKSPQFEVQGDGRQVKISGMEKQTDYEIDLEYKTPDELVGAVATPVFKMQFHRQAKSTK